ncbi:TnsD family Tn7-like transposition protein [Cupriavidus taiwanensis]|uniref:TnsD family Tn7-like transposition protein n=1 Tax=Cupriavidus taiwanensis TaxID=164546 RepID=UPI000E14AE56|nr:TnsD family Tn7-like transposition protein [Cupriavidus taiwanensis]SPC18359.1 hypothetical protein CT19431_MP30300 [Cupriavidus taiwanensis]
MFGSIAPLFPRHPCETTSSIANDLFGEPPMSQKSINMVTVSWPLRKLAKVGDGFYGDTEQLICFRTLLNFRRFSMSVDVFEAVKCRAIEGVSFYGRPRGQYRDFRPPMVCPLCEQEALAQYGTLALLWPHQAPLVDACWEHGVRLVKRHVAYETKAQLRSVKLAPLGEVEFAQDVVTVSEMGRDLDGAVATVVTRLRDAGFQHVNGEFCRTALTDRFQAYVEMQIKNPLLKRIGKGQYAVKGLLNFVGTRKSISPVLLALFLGFLRKAGTTTAAVLPNSNYASLLPSAAWSTAKEPKRSRPERHDALALRLMGYSGLAVAAIKGMKPRTVTRRVSRSGRTEEVQQARFAFLQRTARAAWTAAYRRKGYVSAASVAVTEPRAYSWLLRNDREWLSSHSIHDPSVHKARGTHHRPDQQRRVVGNLQSAMVALVKAGVPLPLTFASVANEAGIGATRLWNWMRQDANLVRAVRPLFHPQGIRATKGLRELFSAL